MKSRWHRRLNLFFICAAAACWGGMLLVQLLYILGFDSLAPVELPMLFAGTACAFLALVFAPY